jgi:hypothetical protein
MAALARPIELAQPLPAPPLAARTLVASDRARVRVRAGSGRDRPRAEAPLSEGRLQIDENGAPSSLEFTMSFRSVGGARADSIEAVLGGHRFSTLHFRGLCRSYTKSRAPNVAVAEFVGTIDLGASARRVIVPLQVIRAEPATLRLIGEATVLGSSFGLARRWDLLPFRSESPLTVVWDLVFVPAAE